ncbi:MAG: anti-sigma factor [Myxococcota bacterium]
MNCRLVQRHLGPYLDGELSPSTQLEFEKHLSHCPDCQQCLEFERSFRGYVQESIESPELPLGFEDRIAKSLDAVESEHRGQSYVAPGRAFWMGLVAVFVVGFAVAMDGLGNDSSIVRRALQRTDRAAFVPMFEEVTRIHSSELPPDVRNGAEVPDYFRGKVRFPVRPAVFDSIQAEFVGARLSNVRDHSAAALYYLVDGRRVTVVVTDSLPVREHEGLARFRFGDSHVLYRHVQGYTVPVRNHRGLTYAFTGDLDEGQVLRLAATSRIER